MTALALASSAFGQTVFPEIEPNGTKAEATAASCMVAGDSVSGTTTGTSVTVANTTLASADTFRVKTCTLPLGVYRHTLTLSTTAGTVPTATIRGLNQTAGVPGTTDSTFSTSSAGVLAWYGFGKQEELYYRVTGVAASTGTYSGTLATTPVVPATVAGTFNPGSITIETVGQTTTDTDMWLYDSNLNPIPCGGNDDEFGGTTLQSRIILPLAAGTYTLAISTYNLANNLGSCPTVDDFVTGLVLDFPDALADTSTTINSSLNFRVTDGVNSTIQAATKALVFGVEFFRIQVGSASTPVTPFCFGDGSGTACPCANSGAAGNGCASSVNAAGANVSGSGIASISADTFHTNGTGMPNASALHFQGTLRINGGAGAGFGDGLRCAGGQIKRLGTKTNVGGASTYPGAGDQPISIRGVNAAGNVRTYQIWYRNAAAFCTNDTFNLTNGIEITWIP